jgi:hypothetical protein
MAAITLGEVARRVDETMAAVKELADKLEQRYQPRELAAAVNDALHVRDDALEERIGKIEEAAAANRRLVLVGLVYPLIVAAVIAVLTLAVHQ